MYRDYDILGMLNQAKKISKKEQGFTDTATASCLSSSPELPDYYFFYNLLGVDYLVEIKPKSTRKPNDDMVSIVWEVDGFTENETLINEVFMAGVNEQAREQSVKQKEEWLLYKYYNLYCPLSDATDGDVSVRIWSFSVPPQATKDKFITIAEFMLSLNSKNVALPENLPSVDDIDNSRLKKTYAVRFKDKKTAQDWLDWACAFTEIFPKDRLFKIVK